MAPNAKPVALSSIGAKLGDAADMNDLLQRREFLGDPQPDVGGAGDDGGVRVFHIELREGLLAGRRGEERRFIADEHIRLVVERAERLQPRRRLACELIVGAGLADFDRRIHDRPIAGAATEIAGQHVVDGVAAGTAIARMIVREQAHHDAGRAEAALRAMQARHRFLHGMQRAVLGEVFDRDQLCAVDLAEQRDAGVNRLVAPDGRRARAPAPRRRRRNRPPRSPPWCRSSAPQGATNQAAWRAAQIASMRTRWPLLINCRAFRVISPSIKPRLSGASSRLREHNICAQQINLGK